MNTQIGSGLCSILLIFGKEGRRCREGCALDDSAIFSVWKIGVDQADFSFSRRFRAVVNKKSILIKTLISFLIPLQQRWDLGSTLRCPSCGPCSAHCWFTFRWSSELVSLCVWLSDKVRRLSAGKKSIALLVFVCNLLFAQTSFDVCWWGFRGWRKWMWEREGERAQHKAN